jgi:hypothetical protein
VTPLASERFQVPEYESTRIGFPRSVHRKEFDYSVYELGAPKGAPAGSDLDIGINDDLNVIRFHAKETSEGHTVRWSQRQSFVLLDVHTGDRTLALWMNNGGRPPAAPQAIVRILLNDRELGAVQVTNGFHEYDVAIPSDLAAAAAATGEPVRVTLRTDTWNPVKLLGAADDRELGVMLDRVAVR